MTTVIDRKRALIGGGLLFVSGFGLGWLISRAIHEKKEARNTEPRIVKLYPDGVDPETWMCEDDELEDSEIAKEISEDNGYAMETDDEPEIRRVVQDAIESSEEYSKFVERNPHLVTIISPNYDKRSEEINNALDFMDNEMLLYFPDEDILATETGDRVDPTEVVGNCLTKYGFSTDDDQREIEVINVQYQTHYIVRKETENSFEDLFPSE